MKTVFEMPGGGGWSVKMGYLFWYAPSWRTGRGGEFKNISPDVE